MKSDTWSGRGVVQQEEPSLHHKGKDYNHDAPPYLWLDLHLQDGAHNGQEVADYDEHIPAVQELALVLIAELAVVVLPEEPAEPLRTTRTSLQLGQTVDMLGYHHLG